MDHRPLDGCSSPIFGQQRAMHIDTTQTWGIQHSLGQDLAIGHHYNHIGIPTADLLLDFLCAQCGGLIYWNFVL